MTRRLVIAFLLLLSFYPVIVHGQVQNAAVEKVQNILREFKKLNIVSYRYFLDVQYPDNQNDHIKGEMYINNEKKVLYNSCDAFTLIYNSDWFYKADHRNKTVTIINLKKNADLKTEGIDKDVFQNGSVSNFVDSVLLKYAKIKSFRKQHDTLNAELRFPDKLPVKKIHIVYNVKSSFLISYSMSIFQPIEQLNGRTDGINEVIRCNSFKKENRIISMEDFFIVNKKGVVLAKYTKYKLYSKL